MTRGCCGKCSTNEGCWTVALTFAPSLRAAEEHLAQHEVDIVLLDLGLPDAQGLGAVRRIRAAAPSVPLVVLTGSDDEALGAQTLQEGAQDYLVKGEVEPRGLVRALRYAVERKSMEEAARSMSLEISHSAHHDSLTGLPNRVLFNDRVSQAVALAGRHGNKVAVLFLDLDGFKYVNDSLGHPIGDKLLRSVAKRLLECVGDSDTVSRQGGDEFLVLLSDIHQLEDAAITARRMLEVVAKAHAIDLHDLHVTTSVGVSVYPDDGLDAEALIKNADIAMYQAKEKGRQGYQFFKPEMNLRAVERQSIEEGLRRALERRELAIHYQPKIDLRTGAISGAEALLRWNHPIRGTVSPAQFIPIAEECGLILPIGAWVLRQACEQAQTWTNAGLPATTIAVNVSAMEFLDEGFLASVFRTLDETGLDPRFLELELTESVLMKHADVAASVLRAVRERGVRVALDDFGTGYSSLSYLRKFPLDTLKIDQSFVRQISDLGDDSAIVTAVIGLANTLNLRVVAEGVETSRQLSFLQDCHCDEAQGYYFSKPVPPERFAQLLADGVPAADFCERRDAGVDIGERDDPEKNMAISIPLRETLEDGGGFLSRELAESAEIRMASVVVITSIAICFFVLPFARMQLAHANGFISAYESALVFCDLVVAVLLFGQFHVLRSWSLLALASGYLFTALLASMQALTFPAEFSPAGLLGGGSQSTIRLYSLWHAGFPLFIIAYAILDGERFRFVAPRLSPSRSTTIPILAASGAVVALSAALTLMATTNQNAFMTLISAGHFTFAFAVTASFLWLLSLVALIALWWRRPRTVLDLWLMVVMCTWLLEIVMSNLINSGRYDVGWYTGRLCGLFAAAVLLVVLLLKNNKYYAQLVGMSVRLRATNESLERLSLLDGLTNLANRRLFDAYFEAQIAIASRYKRMLVLVLCDVDSFKAYNDHYGHLAGDECLKRVAEALRSCCRRPADLAARYGGEEFAMILPETDLIGGVLIAEAAREAVARLRIAHGHSMAGPFVSISGGVAALSWEATVTAQQLIAAADQLLFQAKRLGRNRMASVHVRAA